MKPTKIFLDLDDVLNTFTMSALAKVGCPVGPFDFGKYNPEWGFDILTAANALHRERSFTEAEFWGSLNMEFWTGVPKSRECDWLLDLCAALVGRGNVFVLTAAPSKVGDFVASAKVTWIRQNLPDWLQEQYLIGTCKRACASPEAILIDDTDKNVDAFRCAGGQAILVPRPWNSFHGYETLFSVIMGIDTVFGPLKWVPRKEAA